MMKIAVSQYHITDTLDWLAFTKRMEAEVQTAKKNDADLLLLPEYLCLEFAEHFTDDEKLFTSLQPLLPSFIKLFQRLAKQYCLYIQAGTYLVQTENGQYVNRAYLFGVDGHYHYQDKLQLIAAEKACAVIDHGKQLTVFDTTHGKIGIAICYDSEFPEIVTQLVNAGAWLILVPSLTTTVAGYNRVFLSCRARALENQCYVATSCLLGAYIGVEETERGVGHAAILTPVDANFPDDGLLAAGQINEADMLFGELMREKIENVRQHGQVQNHLDRKSISELSCYPLHLVKL